MRQHLYAPALCLLVLLSFFVSSAASIKEPQKVSITAKHTSLSTSTSNFAATTITPLYNSTVETNTKLPPSILFQNNTIFKKGLFYGFFGMIVLVNLMSFLLFNDKVFGYSAIAITSILALFFNEENIQVLLFNTSIENHLALSTLLLCIAVGCMAMFSEKYLNLQEHIPKLKTFVVPLYIIAFSLAIASWFTSNVILITASNTLSFTVICSYFIAGIALFSKNNYSKFYVIGLAIPLLFSIDHFLLKGLGVTFLNTTLYHVKAAFFFEILLMTYAIVYRMKAIKEETTLRKTEMQIFLKRQEMMNRDSIAKMMEDVYLENLIMHYDLDGVEIKLLQYISEGKENKKIAKKLNTNELDVELMTRDLYQKLNISEAIKEDVNLLEVQPDFIYN